MNTINNKTKGLQDEFLNEAVKKKIGLEINLINGLVLKCKMISYDNFSILVNYNNNNALLYKHSIAFIVKNKNYYK